MKPELCSRPGRSGHSPSGFAQGSLNHLFLLGGKLLGQFQLVFRPICKRLPRQPTLIDGEILGFAHNHGTLDDVLQLADITRPGIRYKKVESFLVYPADALSCFSCETIDEVLDQQGNVVSSFAQRRNFNRKNVETVKQIAAKCAVGDCSLQVAIGGGDDPRVRSDRLIATHTLKLPLLQNMQQRDLSFRWELTDLVKEDGASFCKLEPTQPPLRCPRKSPSLMAEQFRCNQGSRDCSTIRTNESKGRPARSLVDCARDQLFACACFTRQ